MLRKIDKDMKLAHGLGFRNHVKPEGYACIDSPCQVSHLKIHEKLETIFAHINLYQICMYNKLPFPKIIVTLQGPEGI